MKVITIVAFIILGGAAIFSIIPMQVAPGAGPAQYHRRRLVRHGGLPILMTMVAVNFAFSGTELIGIAAGGRKTRIKLFRLPSAPPSPG